MFVEDNAILFPRAALSNCVHSLCLFMNFWKNILSFFLFLSQGFV